MMGAIATRADGTRVASTNGGAAGCVQLSAHAETRLARKLDKGCTVYVARTTKDGCLALARPCARCYAVLKAKGVSRIYYTVNDSEYGVISL